MKFKLRNFRICRDLNAIERITVLLVTEKFMNFRREGQNQGIHLIRQNKMVINVYRNFVKAYKFSVIKKIIQTLKEVCVIQVIKFKLRKEGGVVVIGF